MALLAALALVATVFVAQRTLNDASDVVVRGEADSLVAAVVTNLGDSETPPTATDLARELSEQGSKGLRYVALVGREGRATVEVGEARLSGRPSLPGAPVIADGRARVVAPLMPRHRPRFRHGPDGSRILPDGTRVLPDGSRILPDGTRVEPVPRGDGPHPDGPRGPGLDRPPFTPMLVAIEIEPPVLARLRSGLTRISVTAGVAGAVLVAFAIAFSRSARRLADVEAQAAREQRLVALGTMSSVMAHELRNPLASLKGHAQLLAEDLEDPRQRTKAERVVAEAERIEELTTSLLDFVRDGPVDVEAIAPAALVERALHDLPRERIEVSFSAPNEVRLDATRVARAVHNLVQNGLQASDAGEKVDLDVRAEGAMLVIRVRDRGKGLPAGAEAQIFEPFMTTRVRGVGLGLPVARRIAEQHGGTLTGTNHSEGGAEFVLRLSGTMETS